MNKEDVVCIDSGILLSHQKNEILPFATMWMELEGIMLSDISQSEKDNYHMISLICGIWRQRIIGEEEKMKQDKPREGDKP